MDIENAIERSISHNEIVHCEFEGDEAEMRHRIEENTADFTDYDVSEENDGSLDVYSLDDGDGSWRIRVTLT